MNIPKLAIRGAVVLELILWDMNARTWDWWLVACVIVFPWLAFMWWRWDWFVAEDEGGETP